MAATTTDLVSEPSRADRAKIQALLRMRQFHARTIERASAGSYRRRKLPTPVKPVIKPAATVYAKKSMGWLPPALLAPAKLPKSAGVPLVGYYLPYYATSKIAWTLYQRSPVTPGLKWSQHARWDDSFPGGEAGWDALDPDRAFARLRLQGPNPFLLAASEPDATLDESPTATMFELDHSPFFDGVFPSVKSRFVVDASGQLAPTTISIDGVVHRPGDAGWTAAKRVVNGLDARYSVFGSHLFNCHLIVGQAYAMSAYTLPTSHCLRPFLDFFTYGTLPVNDAAYQSLLTPSSYFVMSNFITHEMAPTFVGNIVEAFDFAECIAPVDIARRGLSAIPDHPYVHDALAAWQAIWEAASSFVDSIYTDDRDVQDDVDLTRWYDDLRLGLLDSSSIPALDGTESLTMLLTVLLFNNVLHEVCGNLAPLFGDAADTNERAAVNIEHLEALATNPSETPPPLAGEVFLVDQAVFISRFNVGGNNLLEVNGDRYSDDPKLQAMLHDVQGRLRDLDAALRALDRDVQFNAMLPRKWEASISF